MARPAYPSDLTDAEWAVLKPRIPAARPGGRPRSAGMREVLNAMFYVARTGCAWRQLPHDLPPWSTVYDYFRQWRRSGTWQRMHDALRDKVRQKAGKQKSPSAALDSQSVKTTKKGGQRLRRGQESQQTKAPLRRGYPRADPGGGGACGRRPRPGRGQARVQEAEGPLQAAGAHLSRRRVCGAVGILGQTAGRLDLGDRQAQRRRQEHCCTAQALDRGADLGVAGPLPALKPGLRIQDRKQRGHDPAGHDQPHEPPIDPKGHGIGLFTHALKRSFGHDLASDRRPLRRITAIAETG